MTDIMVERPHGLPRDVGHVRGRGQIAPVESASAAPAETGWT